MKINFPVKFNRSFLQLLMVSLIIVSAGTACQSETSKIKVEVSTVQNDKLSTTVNQTSTAFNNVFDIKITNNSEKDQNLSAINVTVSADKFIPEGIPYLIGSDEMDKKEGAMLKLITGGPVKNNDNNMYLIFKMDESDYYLIGVATWKTFLCQIYFKDGEVHIKGDGDKKLLKKNESVPFEKVVALRGDSWQTLMDDYADIVVKESAVPNLPKVTWTGWATWDYYKQHFLPEDIVRNTKVISEISPKVNIIQIDGGWWIHRGDYFETRDNITGGIKPMIDKIHEAGFKAGLHFDGYRVSQAAEIVKEHPEYFVHDSAGNFLEISRDPVSGLPLLIWDYSHPGAQKHITEVMRNARENWGVDYFKVDFMWYGLLKGVNHLPVTNVERYRMGITAMKEGIQDAYFLACSPNFGPNIGLVEATRTGPDIQPDYNEIKIRAAHNSANYYFQEKLYNCDPDYLILRSKEESNKRDGKKSTLNDAQGLMWSNFVSIIGNIRLSSDELTLLSDRKKEVIRENFDMPFFEKTIPMDMWDHYETMADAPNFFLAKADNGDICLGLFNWGDSDHEFTVTGFIQDASFKQYNGTGSFKTDSNKLLVSLNGVQSILLKYEGKQSFSELRNNLKLIPIKK